MSWNLGFWGGIRFGVPSVLLCSNALRLNLIPYRVLFCKENKNSNVDNFLPEFEVGNPRPFKFLTTLLKSRKQEEIHENLCRGILGSGVESDLVFLLSCCVQMH